MRLDGRLGQLKCDLALEQDVEARHATLARNPRHARLAIKLKGDDLGADGEVCIEKDVEHGPDHLGLGAGEANVQGAADKGPGAVGADNKLAADDATALRGHVDVLVGFCDGDCFLAVKQDAVV
jgi:hypothetical protein